MDVVAALAQADGDDLGHASSHSPVSRKRRDDALDRCAMRFVGAVEGHVGLGIDRFADPRATVPGCRAGRRPSAAAGCRAS